MEHDARSEVFVPLLKHLAELLEEAGHAEHAASLEELVRLANSGDSNERQIFASQLTTNNYYWLGMGTIADVSFPSQELDHQFKIAYLNLARLCRESGLASRYSEDVEDIFGRWMKDAESVP